jgi:2,3,4,5-tetrahydropyridine-2,6-dicarboxylate N-succinyltransferase
MAGLLDPTPIPDQVQPTRKKFNPGIPVIDSETGQEVSKGYVPPDCVVVRADLKRPYPGGDFFLPCALIIRRLQAGDREYLNDILRESDVVVS